MSPGLQFILRQKRPAQHRLDTENIEIVGRDKLPDNPILIAVDTGNARGNLGSDRTGKDIRQRAAILQSPTNTNLGVSASMSS